MADVALSRKNPARKGTAAGRKRPGRTRPGKRPSSVRPRARRARGWLRAWHAAPGWMQIVLGAIAVLALSLTVNWIYQVARKPSELFFPVSGALSKTPAQTWGSYAPIFRRYSTASITPELLAALAQTEGAGNPIARTYWRWSWQLRPLDWYRPASSSVGMYQMTDGTFAQARKLCVRRHTVVDAGAWNDWNACWFNGLYVRVIPSHAVELTSALLDREVASTLARNRITASPLQTQHLAATIHLCGAGAGDSYARHGFRFAPGQRCGDHDPRAYLSKVDALRAEFKRLSMRD